MQQNENNIHNTEETLNGTKETPNVEESSPNNNNSKPERDSRFKEGEKITMINVRFPGNAKSHPFLMGKKKLSYNQKVLAMSDRGMTIGYISSFPYEVEFEKSMLPLKSISQVPSDDEIKAKDDLEEKEKKTEDICKKLIEKHELDMVITHVEIIQFGKKAVFYFNAPSRVDFRGLVKDLVSELKMRIELRQISIRDRAAGLGAIASCGQKTCCSYFLKDYGNVSIKMAKNQNITLLPGKINGVCGQIKCCMRFENDLYTEKRERLPKEGSFLKTKSGDCGKVLRLNLMEETFDLLTDKAVKKRFYREQFKKDNILKDGYEFPQRFEQHIIDETSNIIGEPHNKKCQADCVCDGNCDCHTPSNERVDLNNSAENSPNKQPNRDDKNEGKRNDKRDYKQNSRHNKKTYHSNKNKKNRKPYNKNSRHKSNNSDKKGGNQNRKD